MQTHWLDKFERRFGWLRIPHLLPFIIIAQIIVFFLIMGADEPREVEARLTLLGFEVLGGDWYRVLTFYFLPITDSPIFNVIGWYMLWVFGVPLIQEWGEFKFTVFVLTTWIMSIIVALAFPLVPVMNSFALGTFFLAFARLYPNYTILAAFVLPIQARWIGWISWGMMLAAFFSSPPLRPQILAAISGYLLIFGADTVRDIRHKERGRKFRQQTRQHEMAATHVCVVCGKTDLTDPEMEFRYVGEQCYCIECMDQIPKT